MSNKNCEKCERLHEAREEGVLPKEILCPCPCHITPHSDHLGKANEMVKPEGVGEWAEEFDKTTEDLVICDTHGFAKNRFVKDFISTLILQEKAKCMADFEKRLEEYRNSPDVWKNVGVSKWRNWGEQNGYFEFFKAKWKGEIEKMKVGYVQHMKSKRTFDEGNGYDQALVDIVTLIDKL